MMSLPEKIDKWGRAVLVSCAILVGTATVGAKIMKTVNAGPSALLMTDALNRRVTRLEKQSRFVVRGIEQLTRTKYKHESMDED